MLAIYNTYAAYAPADELGDPPIKSLSPLKDPYYRRQWFETTRIYSMYLYHSNSLNHCTKPATSLLARTASPQHFVYNLSRFELAENQL